MTTVVLVFLQDPHFNSCDKYPEVGLLDHTVVLFLVFAAPWMKLKDIVPSEISQPQKDTYGMTSPVWGILNYQIHRIKEWNGDCQGLRDGEMRILNKHKVLVKQDE